MPCVRLGSERRERKPRQATGHSLCGLLRPEARSCSTLHKLSAHHQGYRQVARPGGRRSPSAKPTLSGQHHQDEVDRGLLADDRLFKYAMKAHGLKDMDYAKAFMKKALVEGIDDTDSFANKLSDKLLRVRRNLQFRPAWRYSLSSPGRSRARLTSICVRHWRKMPQAERRRAAGFREGRHHRLLSGPRRSGARQVVRAALSLTACVGRHRPAGQAVRGEAGLEFRNASSAGAVRSPACGRSTPDGVSCSISVLFG